MNLIIDKILKGEVKINSAIVKCPPKKKSTLSFDETVTVIGVHTAHDRGITISFLINKESVSRVHLTPSILREYEVKELWGYGKLLGLTIPIYMIKRREPLIKRFLPIDCDSIKVKNHLDEPVELKFLYIKNKIEMLPESKIQIAKNYMNVALDILGEEEKDELPDGASLR